jgi:hypothetical protein
VAGYRSPLAGGRWHSPKQFKESEKEGDQMTTQQCEECFELFATASEYLNHKGKEHGEKYGIRAIFTCEGKEDKYTNYSEQIFNSEEEALEAINDNYGEQLSQDATIDTENASEDLNPDLIGYLYEDLEPYLLEEVK